MICEPSETVRFIVVVSMSRLNLPRRLRKAKNQSCQEYRRDDLASQRYPPFLTVPCASPCHITTISDPCSEDLSESVEELLQARDLASDLAMCELGLVDGDLERHECQSTV
jgi:hypothetical protein